MQPPIKWTGSKRGQANEILSFFPSSIKSYYEPFLGGGSVFLSLLEKNWKVEQYIVSDLNQDLINLWLTIKDNTEALISDYSEKWNTLKNHKNRSLYYLEIRKKFNTTRNSMDFFFLNRTCFNGLIRYNSKNQFNTFFHFGRGGIIPEKISKILNKTQKLLNRNEITFLCLSFDAIQPKKEDFIYLDPPYFNTKGIYFNNFKFNDLICYLKSISCPYVLSYDGKRNGNDLTVEIPKNLFDKHIYTKAQNSSFSKLKNSQSLVEESLYIRN